MFSHEDMSKGDKGIIYYLFQSRAGQHDRESTHYVERNFKMKYIHFNMVSKPWIMGKSGLLLVFIDSLIETQFHL